MTQPGVAAYGTESCAATAGCITCGDTAVEMRVVSADPGDGLAVCASRDGALEEVDVSLVGPVARGATVLVHAAVALTTLEPARVEGAQ